MKRTLSIIASVAILASASPVLAATKQPKVDNGGCTMKICVDNGVAMGHPLANAKRWCAEKMPTLYGPMCKFR